MHLTRVTIAESMDIGDYKDKEFEKVKKFMESNTEVNYECNKY